ncbi:unnamed protein product, partial [marine sediment metagenome]
LHSSFGNSNVVHPGNNNSTIFLKSYTGMEIDARKSMMYYIKNADMRISA